MRHIIFLSILMSAVLAPAKEPERTYIDEIAGLCDSIITLPVQPHSSKTSIEIRYSPAKSKPSAGLSPNYVSIIWADTDSSLTWRAELRPGQSSTDDAVSDRFLCLRVIRANHSGDSTVHEAAFHDILKNSDAEISFCAEITPTSASFAAGSSTLEELTAIEGSFNPSVSAAVKAAGCVSFSMIVIETHKDMAAALATDYTEEQIRALATTSGSPEGIWLFLDRDTDSRRALAGGRYRLGIVKQKDSPNYDIIYLDGAQVNASAWRCGMKKGELTPTIFSDHYDLLWYDSHMEPIEYDANASVSQGAVLTLSFPLMKSTLRFSRQPQDNISCR